MKVRIKEDAVVFDVEEVLTVAETAKYLGIGEATVWRRIKAGKLLPIHAQGRTLISTDQADALKLAMGGEKWNASTKKQ